MDLQGSIIGVDIETTTSTGNMSDPYLDRIVSLALSDGESVWILTDEFERAIPILTDPNIIKVVHNYSFDGKFINHHLGVHAFPVHDSLIAERIIYAGDIETKSGLADVLPRRLGVYVDKSLRSQFASHAGELTAEQKKYIEQDVIHLPALYHSQMEDVSAMALGRVIALENRVVYVTADMEYHGIGFDAQLWETYKAWITSYLYELKQQIARVLSVSSQQSMFQDDMELDINLNSTPQVLKKLAELGIKTKTTAREALEKIADKHPFIPLLLEYRKWSKRTGWDYDTFVHPITGRIHPSWNQTGSQAGRFSCSNPNMQQVERPVEGHPNLRHLFPPADGYIYVVADFGQQEPRVLAQISQDPRMIAACNTSDVYSAYAEMLGTSRQNAKTAVLALAYGGYWGTIVDRLGVDEQTARDVEISIKRTFPIAMRWGDQQFKYLMQHKYVKTLLGRRRNYRNAGDYPVDVARKMFGREARNTPIQGSAADMTKLTMANLYAIIPEYGARIVLQVHDELVCEVPVSRADEFYYQMIGAFESAGQELCPNVKTPADVHIMTRWDKG